MSATLAPGPIPSLEKAWLGAFALVTVVLVVVGAMAVRSLLAYGVEARRLSHTHEVIVGTEGVLTTLLDLETDQWRFVITGDEGYFQRYVAARALVDDEIGRLRKLIADNSEQRQPIEALEALAERRLAIAHHTVDLRQSGGATAAQSYLLSGEGKDLMDQVRQAVHEIVGAERSLLALRDREMQTSAQRTLAALGGFGGLAAVVLAFSWFHLKREIAGRRRSQQQVERVRAELALRATELAAASQRIQAKNDELKDFAYTISHDLKAPLRGIAGYAQELTRRHQAGLSERAMFCIEQIITAAKNLDCLIEDLLKLSRLDAETPAFTEVPLARLVQSILRDRGQALEQLKVELSVDVPPIALRTWERGLNQMLANLIDNAVKYSRGAKPPRVAIHAETAGGVCRISVADNGIGFDMKHHDRIFGIFNRLVRASEFEGTGAGLAIARKVADKLGGSIRAESAPGRGATFIVELPLSGATESPA